MVLQPSTTIYKEVPPEEKARPPDEASGRNDDRLANPNGKNVPQAFVDRGEDGPWPAEIWARKHKNQK